LLVDLGRFPNVRRRVELNQRLLEQTCPFDQRGDQRPFTVDDLDLLLLVAAERFGAEAALLRRQAVIALGVVDDERAVETLVDLAVNPVEHDSVRIVALTALPPERVEELSERLADDLSAGVATYAKKLRTGRTERPPTPGHIPRDPETTGRADCDCRQPRGCC
jgi:hypothetical protein